MPRCQVCSPSTWSWKNTLSSTTSGYQRDWTNSTPAHSPAGWSRFRGAASVTVFATGSMAWIVAGSMSSVPSPSAIDAPRWNLATLVRCTIVEPAGEPDVICGSSSLYARTDCSYENPEITPSEACGSNCTWWTWRLIFEKPSVARASLISDVSVRCT